MLDFERILNLPSPLQKIEEPLFDEKEIEVFIKRDDLIHSEISGNKFRKLKYNILNIKQLNQKGLLTFGGAFSNHIHATSAAGKLFGFETIGVIRGDELNENSSQTLKFASENGMNLVFVSRTDFRELKKIASIAEISKILSEKYLFKKKLTNFAVVPEGGTNDLALKGGYELVEELIQQLDKKPNYIITAVGSGGTLAGICSNYHQEILPVGVAVLKNGGFIFDEITDLLKKNNIKDFQFEAILEAHCGGYAKITPELLNFIKGFEAKHSIKLEQVYTGKVFFEFYNQVEKDYFKPNSTVVIVHTGGLQGRSEVLD